MQQRLNNKIYSLEQFTFYFMENQIMKLKRE